MEISKKGLYIYLAVLSVLLLFAWTANADTIVSQTTGGTNTTPVQNGSHIGQHLGTGLTGTVSSIKVGFTATTTANQSWILLLYSCPNANDTYTGCTQVSSNSAYIFSSVSYSPGSYVLEASTSPIVLDPTKYYKIFTQMFSSSGNSMVPMGSNTNTYSGGACFFDSLLSTPGTCGSVADLYFILQGAVGQTQTTQQGIKTIISPSNQSTTANNTPTFSYTYYVDTDQGTYNRVGVVLRDQTNNQSINTVGASTTINASGLQTYSQPIGVTTGHLYSWQPIMYTTDNSLPPLYGPTYVFYAVTTANYQSLYTQQATSANPYATTTIYSCATTNSCWVASATSSFQYASTTVTARCPISQLPDVVARQMAIKMPFSYICDIAQLMTELAYGNGNYQGDVIAHLPNSFNGSTTNARIISQSQISAFNELAPARQLMRYTVYFITALAIISMALGAL